MKKSPKLNPRTAIVHDWLTGVGGAERNLVAICQIFPEATLYTSTYIPHKTLPFFKNMKIKTSFLQKIPWLRNRHQLALFGRYLYWRFLNLKEYDLIISSSGSEAKAVRTTKAQLHINYCYSPTHYYWSHYKDYLRSPGLGLGWDFLARLILRLFIRPLRWLDYKAAQRPDLIIAISASVSDRIKKYYNRQSFVIFPPVEPGLIKSNKRQGYIALGRLVPYKGFETAILACNQLQASLTIVGSGPQTKSLKKIAGPTIKFVGQVNEKEKFKFLSKAKACLFAGEDDFGLVPVESMSVGTPVIALAAGGALDTVVENKTGLFFKEQTPEGLLLAIKRFESKTWSSATCRRQASKFSPDVFKQKLSSYINRAWRDHENCS